MTGVFVLSSDVSEAGDQIFHQLLFGLFSLFSSSGSATSGTDLDDDLVTRSNHGHTLDVQITDLDGVEDIEVADVDGDDLGKILSQTADLDLTDRLFQLTTAHDTRGATFDGERQNDGDGLVFLPYLYRLHDMVDRQ